MEKITNLSVHFNCDHISEQELYTKLDLVIQFLLKNDFKGSIVINRTEYQFDDSGED